MEPAAGHTAEIILRCRPLQRNPFARQFLQRCAISFGRVLETLGPAFALAEFG